MTESDSSTKEWTITFKDQWTQEAGPDDGEFPDVERWEFDIRYYGKQIGSVEYDNYFGHITADFGARTVELSNYVEQYVDNPEEVIIQAIENYFDSDKGKQHFEVLARQKDLDVPLEEIKVTKTLAGKKQSPSRQLAMKLKKQSPNQGKKPVELDKMRNAKDLATIQLKGEYNQRTK